jgi:hypothetical protein
MPDKWWPRIHRPAKSDEQEIRNWREAIARSIRILRQSEPPDTFLGRRTQAPFTSEDME